MSDYNDDDDDDDENGKYDDDDDDEDEKARLCGAFKASGMQDLYSPSTSTSQHLPR